MVARQKRKEFIPERTHLEHPGDPEPDWCSPGSIEQELDMCETGGLRGDDILHSHGIRPRKYTGDPQALDQVINQNWDMDLAEEDREGAEMSGDEHSFGAEGGESELLSQVHTPTGLPGDRTRREEQEARLEPLIHPEEEKQIRRIRRTPKPKKRRRSSR